MAAIFVENFPHNVPGQTVNLKLKAGQPGDNEPAPLLEVVAGVNVQPLHVQPLSIGVTSAPPVSVGVTNVPPLSVELKALPPVVASVTAPNGIAASVSTSPIHIASLPPLSAALQVTPNVDMSFDLFGLSLLRLFTIRIRGSASVSP